MTAFPEHRLLRVCYSCELSLICFTSGLWVSKGAMYAPYRVYVRQCYVCSARRLSVNYKKQGYHSIVAPDTRCPAALWAHTRMNEVDLCPDCGVKLRNRYGADEMCTLPPCEDLVHWSTYSHSLLLKHFQDDQWTEIPVSD
jgi:hypothetical protein